MYTDSGLGTTAIYSSTGRPVTRNGADTYEAQREAEAAARQSAWEIQWRADYAEQQRRQAEAARLAEEAAARAVADEAERRRRVLEYSAQRRAEEEARQREEEEPGPRPYIQPPEPYISIIPEFQPNGNGDQHGELLPTANGDGEAEADAEEREVAVRPMAVVPTSGGGGGGTAPAETAPAAELKTAGVGTVAAVILAGLFFLPLIAKGGGPRRWE